MTNSEETIMALASHLCLIHVHKYVDRKRHAYIAGPQEVSRCHTRGELGNPLNR